MNQIFLKKILLFIVCTSTFIKVSSMASGSATSRLLANNRFLKTTSLQNQTRPYRSKIPLEQSNKALQRALKEEPKSKKSNWYQGKKWTYPLAAGLGVLYSYESNKKIAKEKQENLKYYWMINSKDAKDHDPEIYKLFLKIKEALGVTENIDLRISNNDLGNHSAALYNNTIKTILLNNDYKTWHPIARIQTLAHELGHVKQFHLYPDSYHKPTVNKMIFLFLTGQNLGVNLKAETGADANAAGYFDCPECLQHLSNVLNTKTTNPLLLHAPQDLPFGYFSTSLGYFSKEDYKPYIERAYLDGELCEAHKLKKQPEISKFLWDQKINNAMYNPLDLSFKSFITGYKDFLKENNNEFIKSLPTELFLPKTEPKK